VRELLGKCLSGTCALLGFLWIGFSRSKRGWHDYIAGTAVWQDAKAVKRGQVILIIVLVGGLLYLGLKECLTFAEARSLQAKNVVKVGAIDVSSLTPHDYEPFVTYLREKGAAPVEYIADLFQEHDVVMLGELHEVRETCQLIGNLIEPLYRQRGVRVFAMEVLKYKNTALANQLVTGDTYDEELALSLLRDCGWPSWGFQEYIDIFAAIWQLNKSLPPGAEKFKVVGLDSNWDGAVLMTGRHLWNLPGTIYRMANRDKFMAKVLEWEVLEKGKKALVQIGANHAFTEYHQPIVRKGKLVGEMPGRFGCILYKKYGTRVFQVALHRWDFPPELATEGENVPLRQPFGGFLEDVFAAYGNTPVGLDIAASPFAHLRDARGYWFAFQKYTVFADIAQGYVFLAPLNQLHRVSWAKGFVNEKNYAVLRAFLRQRGGLESQEDLTYKGLNDALKRWHDKKTFSTCK
jgi:hypothetical protein